MAKEYDSDIGRMKEDGYWYLIYMQLPRDSLGTEDGDRTDAYN